MREPARQVLMLARFPTNYIKKHGMGEFRAPLFPGQDILPYLWMAYEGFGEQRLTWGRDYPRVVPREGSRDSLKFTKEHMPSSSSEKFELVFGNTALSLSMLAQE